MMRKNNQNVIIFYEYMADVDFYRCPYRPCEKKYKHQSGQSRHKKKCKYKDLHTDMNIVKALNTITDYNDKNPNIELRIYFTSCDSAIKPFGQEFVSSTLKEHITNFLDKLTAEYTSFNYMYMKVIIDEICKILVKLFGSNNNVRVMMTDISEEFLIYQTKQWISYKRKRFIEKTFTRTVDVIYDIYKEQHDQYCENEHKIIRRIFEVIRASLEGKGFHQAKFNRHLNDFVLKHIKRDKSFIFKRIETLTKVYL